MSPKSDATPGTEVTPVLLQDIAAALVNPEYKVQIIEDGDQAQAEIVARILGAETIEDAFAKASITSPQDVIGHEIRIDSVAWRSSELEKGVGVFGACKGEDLTDHKEITLAAGNRTMVAHLVWALRNDALPLVVRIIEVGKAKVGQSAPLGFELVVQEKMFAS